MHLKKYFISILLFFVAASSLVAQEVIKGRVVDASNGEPVEFANLGVIDSFTGNASDEAGFFELKIPEDLLDKKIRVSAVGYQTEEYEIRKLLDEKELTFEMVPVIYNIKEVSVEAPSRVLYGMLKMAIRQRQQNYINDAYSADVRYREKRGDRTKILQLAYTDDSGYSERTREDAFVSRNYKITEGERNYEQSPFADGLIRVEELLGFDMLRNPGNVLDTVFLDKFRVFEKEKYVEEGKHIIVIGFECKSPQYAYSGDTRIEEMKGEVHLVQNDMSILQSIVSYQSGGWLRHGRSFMATDEMISENTKGIRYTVETEYTPAAGEKMAVSRIRMKINDQPGSDAKDTPSDTLYDLVFENVSPGEKTVEKGQRDYYDDASVLSGHLRW